MICSDLMAKLSSLINIGKKVEQDLQGIGLFTAEEFLQADPYQVFHILHQKEPRSCRCMLATIVGAHQGIKWPLVHKSAAIEYEKRYPEVVWNTSRKGC